MTRIVCVHATHRAVEPTDRILHALTGEYERSHILDEDLFRLEAKGEAAKRCFLRILRSADLASPDLILTTCSMYTQFLPQARQHIATPLLGVDEAMIQHAAQAAGPMTLVGSLDSALQFTAEQIQSAASILGTKPEIERLVKVELDSCQTEEKTAQFAQQLLELHRSIPRVYVIQLSLSPVEERLSGDDQREILTSRRLATQRLREMLN